MTRALVIDCGGCGAPLGGSAFNSDGGGLVPCLYCGALLRLEVTSGGEAAVVERKIPVELVERVRAAALRGGRDEAIDVCVREGGVSGVAAAAAVDDVIRSVATKVVFAQALNGIGWTLVFVSAAVAATGVVLLVNESTTSGAIALAVGALFLMLFARGVRNSLLHVTAARADAYIRSSVLVGPTGFSDGSLIYSLALDVAPGDGNAPFHARLVLPVKNTSPHKVERGKTIAVRYRDDGAWIRADS